jgi:glycosyltransferase involved in cell wall biosynthesis
MRVPYAQQISGANLIHQPDTTSPLDGSTARAPQRGIPILSLAHDFWTDVPRCRHHVMTRLAVSGHRVLFVAPHIELRAAVRNGWKTRPLIRAFSRVQENLYTFVPPAWLPSNYRFPRLDRLTAKARILLLKGALGALGMRSPIVYVWHPEFVDMVDSFDDSVVVYHCYDEYAAFTGADRKRVEQQERRLLGRADIVFAVSEGLCNRKRQLSPNVFLLRNGVDYDRFAMAQLDATEVPEDVAAIPRPIVGCITRVVPEFFDAALLGAVFSARPDWSLVVIGPELRSGGAAAEEVRALKQLPNVHFVGRRPFEQLPAYLKAMDVCVIPYRPTENKLLADPLKLYEYLAAGKPVVCPRLALDETLQPLVTIATGAREWIARIETAIAADTADCVAMRQAAARLHTWDTRIAFVLEKIGATLSRRAALAAPSP